MRKFTVFANFFIDTEERFLRLKDSFFSFSKANIHEWCINIRGNYKQDVKKFLENNISKNLKVFFLESNEGWINDSLEVTKNINTEIIFFWLEDHICTTDVSKINLVVEEMYENKIDHLIYSFFHKGIFIEPLDAVHYEKKKNISFFLLDSKNHNKLKTWYEKKNIKPHYIISCCSFMSLKLFKKNLLISKKKKKYNKMLPFNFEKNFLEDQILPFNNGVVNNELFVSIDDDHGEQGYSLISRKQYPVRVSKKQMDEIRKSKIKIFVQNPLKKTIEKIFTLFK